MDGKQGKLYTSLLILSYNFLSKFSFIQSYIFQFFYILVIILPRCFCFFIIYQFGGTLVRIILKILIQNELSNILKLYLIINSFTISHMQTEQVQYEQYQNCQFVNDYKLHFLLGQGGQASVYLGSKANQLYALKVYALGMNKDEAFKRQVDFLNNLKHKYLISIVDSDSNAQVKLKNSKPQKRAMIALEFAQAQLFDFISKEGRFTPEICRTLFKQMIEAIKFLDDRGITHRDLKPQNILFDKQFNFKISDFGLSTFTEGHDKDGVLYSRVGTEGYKPPEMENGKYAGLQADLFAAGVILFVMYNGTPPFMSTKPIDKIYKLIKDKNFAKFWSLHEKKKPLGFYPDSLKRLLNEFFSFDPTKRPTFTSLAEDEWLNGDSAMGQQLKQYMQKRYDRIAQEDQVKKKIAQVRKQMFMNQAMQQQNCSLDQSAKLTRKDAVKVFIERAKEFNQIKIQTLPETQKNVRYFNQDIGFVLAFVKDYLEQSFKDEKVFLEDFFQDIKPSKFQMKVLDKQIELRFVFDVDEEDQQTLKINGSLYQKQGKLVGFQWKKVEGNDFWLNSILKDLSQRLNVLE